MARKGPTLACTNIVLPKAIHSPMLINSKLYIRKSLKLPMRQKRQYTFARQILNSIKMLPKWLCPVYTILQSQKIHACHHCCLRSLGLKIGIYLMEFHPLIDERMMCSSTRAQRAGNLNSN